MNRTLDRIAQAAAQVVERMRVGPVAATLILALGFGFPLAAQAATPSAMAFELRSGADCGQSGCIVATGLIEASTAADFKTFLRKNAVAPGATVVMDSAGGDLVQGLKFGLMVRKQGLSTVVAHGGQCASACAYAFLGGVQRTVAPGARYGVHQFKAADLSATETQRMVGVLADYLTAVGAGSGIVTAALRTPPHRMYWMSSAELTRHAVTNRT